MTAPPDVYINWAVKTAALSPCRKSKRGAVVFNPLALAHGETSWPAPIGVGYNGQPSGECDGTVFCWRDCGKICEHAEHRAIRDSLLSWKTKTLAVHKAAGIKPLALYDLVHVKVVGGALAAGGPPSCWQCSREIASVGIDGVWLFELDAHWGGQPGDWVRYSAAEFHHATLRHCKLHPYAEDEHELVLVGDSPVGGSVRCSCGFDPNGDQDELAEHIAMARAAK